MTIPLFGDAPRLAFATHRHILGSMNPLPPQSFKLDPRAPAFTKPTSKLDPSAPVFTMRNTKPNPSGTGFFPSDDWFRGTNGKARKKPKMTAFRFKASAEPSPKRTRKSYNSSTSTACDIDETLPGTPPNLDINTAFRQALFEARNNKESARFWEKVYGQPIHIHKPYYTDATGTLRQMKDDQYVLYVQYKLWSNTLEGRHELWDKMQKRKCAARDFAERKLYEDIMEAPFSDRCDRFASHQTPTSHWATDHGRPYGQSQEDEKKRADDQRPSEWEYQTNSSTCVVEEPDDGPQHETKQLDEDQFRRGSGNNFQRPQSSKRRAERQPHEELSYERMRSFLVGQEKQREETRQRLEREATACRAQAREQAEQRRRAQERCGKTLWENVWTRYVDKWQRWDGKADEIPWPVTSIGLRAQNKAQVRQFFEISLDRKALGDAEFAVRLKTERNRWHPDKFQRRMCGRMEEEIKRQVTTTFQIIDDLREECLKTA